MKDLYNKYTITKNDGTSVDPKAVYFVLRLDTDKAARKAVRTYAIEIASYDNSFANRLWDLVRKLDQDEKLIEEARRLKQQLQDLKELDK